MGVSGYSKLKPPDLIRTLRASRYLHRRPWIWNPEELEFSGHLHMGIKSTENEYIVNSDLGGQSPPVVRRRHCGMFNRCPRSSRF